MDAFYVSVELQRRPQLRGLPVVVAGSGPRAVVTTASYEARRFGVFSATPAARARRLCPQAVFVAPDFDHYRARSSEVMDVLRSQVERVEVVGLDEAYLDLSALGRPKAAARRVKASVQQATGLCCSIGIGPSKLVAKVASDAEKPDGFVAAQPGRGPRAIRRRVPGVDPRHRPQVGGAPAPPGHRDARPARRCAPGPRGPAPPGALRGRPRAGARPRAQVGVARDDLRLRPARRGRAAAGAGAPQRAALRRPGPSRAARSDDRDQGAPGRLLHAHARAERARRRSTTWPPSGAWRASSCQSSTPDRPVRLLGVRVAGLDEAAPAPSDQMSLAL